MCHDWTCRIAGKRWCDNVLGRVKQQAKGFCCLLVCALFCSSGLGSQSSPDSRTLADLSLQELANLEITTVAKKEVSLSQAAASVFVITANDIRRSGATSLPEALRLAPNLSVAQVDANVYAISSRGFNGTTSNKLQVLIDGRIVYTPLYSGVFWDVQDVLLDDIDRIEVISGPAAVQWGANAVNGVINVITRNSADTQGSLLKAGGGNREKTLAARHGGEFGSNGHYRVYAKFIEFEETERAGGAAVDDSWDRNQVGFRVDWMAERQSLQLQGDAYNGELDQPLFDDRDIAGANLSLRWRRSLDSGASVRLNAYHDYTERDYPGTFAQRLHTAYLELIHSLQPTGRHNIQWSIDYRYSRDRIDNSDSLAFLPDEKNLDWASLTGQDEIHLRDNLRLTLGVRIEHNDYTDTELMPSARLAWTPYENQLWWGAASRAVRTPSRIDTDFFIPGKAPFLLAGGPDFRSELADVYQAGYRASSEAFSWSITLFYADYDHLRSVKQAEGGQFVFDNGLEGSSKGIEAWGNYQLTGNWRLSWGYMALKKHLRPKSGSISDGASEGNDPSHQWLLRSQLDLASDKEFDVMVRRVGSLPQPEAPSYMAVDMRLAWWIQPELELSLTANNLFDDRHPEFGAAPGRSEIERSFLVGLRWNF